MNKIYKVIWSKVRNCYVAVSEIAKRNGKSCTSVNCGAKANRGRAGVALAIALSLSLTGGGVAWGDEINVSNSITINDNQSSNTYIITADNISFTVTGIGKIRHITSEKSGNTLEIKSGGQATSGTTYIGVSNNTVTVAGSHAGGIWGGYSQSNNVDVTNNKVTVSGTVGSGNAGDALHGGLAANSGNVTKNAVLIDGGTVNTVSVTGGYSFSGEYAGGNNTSDGNSVTITNGKVYTYKSTTTPDVSGIYGGRIGDGSGSVINNSVTISGTSEIGKKEKNSDTISNTIVYGGKAISGIAERNKVEISGGTIYADVYGGYSAQASANSNTVKISGTVSGGVYGGYSNSSSTSSSANRNEVTIQGTVTSDVNGGNAYYGNASSNKVYIKSGASAQKVAGGSAREYGSAETNTVEISGGTVSDIVMGGFSQRGIAGGDTKVKGNTVTISAGSVTNHVYGGYSPNTETNNKAIYNTVEIKGGTIGGASKSIYGGYAGQTAQYNIVTITDGTVTADVYGGYSKNSAALNNSVTIKETGEVTGNVYGGSGSGANYNTVTINGVTVTGDVYGGYNSGSSANNTAYNTVELNGASVNGSITGGTYDKNGNTLFLSGAGNTVTGDINKFATINIADSVAWNSGTTVLSAKKYDDGALSKPQLNITEATGLSGATTYGTMTLLATTNTNTNLSGIKLKYNDGDPVTLSATAATPKLSQVVKAGTTIGNTSENSGVTLTYNVKEHIVALDTANNYKNVLYSVKDNVTGITFGNMTWGSGRTLASGNNFVFYGNDTSTTSGTIIDASNLSFTGTIGSNPIGQSMTLLSGATGITNRNITQPTGAGKGTVAVQYATTANTTTADYVLFDATASGSVAVDSNNVNFTPNSVTLDKVTFGTFAWEANNSNSASMPTTGWSASAATQIDASNLAFTGTIGSDPIGQTMTLLSGATGITDGHLTQPTAAGKGTVAVQYATTANTTTANYVRFDATASGSVTVDSNSVKYTLNSIALDKATLGSFAWGADVSMPTTGWSASESTTIDDTNFAYTGTANTKLKQNDTAVILNATGLTTSSPVTLGTNANKTVAMSYTDSGTDDSSGFNFVGTANGHVAADADKVNYFVDSVTLNSINLSAWTGTAYNINSTDGWVLSTDAQSVVNASGFSLPSGMTLATGEKKVIVEAVGGTDYFKDIKIEGTNNVWSQGGEISDTNTVNGVSLTGTETQGGIKVNELNMNQIIYESSKKNVTGITLGEVPKFTDGGIARKFDSDFDVSNATITTATNFGFADTSSMETGLTMTILDATGAISYETSGQTLKDFDAITNLEVDFSDTITDPTNSSTTIAFAGKHTDTLALNEESTGVKAKTKLIYTVGDKFVETATLSGPIAWSDGGTYYTNGTAANQNGTKATYKFDGSSEVNINGVQFNAVADPLAGATKSMTLLKNVNDVAANKVSGTPSFTVALDQTNTKLDASASGSAAVSGSNVAYTVSGVALDKITVKSANGTADKVPANWTLATGAAIETDSMTVPELAAGTHVDILQSDTDGFFANVPINGANAYGKTQDTFTESDAAKSVTIAGTQDKGVTLNSEKNHLIYKAGTLDVASVTLGPVEWKKGATVFDRSGAGYNYAGVAALGTDGFAVSYASPETVATGDSMTLLQANATLKDMAEQVKKTSYSYTPVEGVTVDANITGKLAASGGAVTYTAAENQASKLTFTSVDWKDSGALMTRPSNITFAGADVDTTKIHFQNVKELDANKKMTLVSDFGDSVGTITGTKYTVGAGLEGEGAASLSGSDLVFTTKTGARDLAAQEQTHNTLMVMEAGMAVLAAGNEYVSQTMAELANPQNAGLDGTVTAASLGGSKSRYKTGSHVDSNNWNVAVAVGSKRELKKGSLEWGVFGEYGKSNYTLHSDAGRGDGDSHYAGGGLMAKWTNKHDVYTEASVRLGRLNDTASNLLRDAAGNGYGYDVHANYFGAHVGIGKIIHYKGGKSLDVYGKYFYTKRDGVDFTSGGNNYSLDSVASSILRVGARYGTTDKKWNWYGGLAYEYEFDGKSEGTVDGVGIRAASVKGGSVRGEIGLRMSATKTNPWQTDISIYGYGGKHRGFGGSVNVAYMF